MILIFARWQVIFGRQPDASDDYETLDDVSLELPLPPEVPSGLVRLPMRHDMHQRARYGSLEGDYTYPSFLSALGPRMP